MMAAPTFSPENEAKLLFALLRSTRLEDGQLEKAKDSLASAISEGATVCVDGGGRSLDVMLSLKSMLLGLGANAHLAKEPPKPGRGSKYMAISGSGATAGPLERIKLAGEAGMETILVTESASLPENRMAKMADIIVELQGPELTSGAAMAAPMGTVFEEAAFVSCLTVFMGVLDELGRLPAELEVLSGKKGKSYGGRYLRLLDVSENGLSSGTGKVAGLAAEAGGAAHIVERLYRSKQETAKSLRLMGDVPEELASGIMEPEVLLAGEGTSDYILEMFAQRLYQISFGAHMMSGAIVPPITKEKIVIPLSCSGESSLPVTAAKIAAMKGAWFSPITASGDSSLAEVARGAGRPVVKLSGLYGRRSGGFFAERCLGGQLSVPDPVFSTKALILLDSIIAKEISLLGLTERELKKRHQQDKPEYL